MQVVMSIVGMPNVTVTCHQTMKDQAEVYGRWLDANKDATPGDEMPVKLCRKNHFHSARKRLVSDGAEGTQFFPVEV